MENLLFAGLLILAIMILWLFVYFYNKLSIKVGVVEAHSDEFCEEYACAKKLLQEHIAGKVSKWAYDKADYYLHLSDYGITSVKEFEYYKKKEAAYKSIGEVIDKKRTLSKTETLNIVKILEL